jgi:hypothetical protein
MTRYDGVHVKRSHGSNQLQNITEIDLLYYPAMLVYLRNYI